jgi:iron(II)-dependent oxidoreductase
LQEISIAATPVQQASAIAREGSVVQLRDALVDSRSNTLAVFALYEAALPQLQVPFGTTLNPPLWELGHIGWFQEFWLARNPQRSLGVRADPQALRTGAVRAKADDLYNSSLVPHASRWSLPLPDAAATRADLAAQLQGTLDLLTALPAREPGSDTADAALEDELYFFRLALHHEDMHHEAALYMAQALGIALATARAQVPVLPTPGEPLRLPATTHRLGVAAGITAGFAFDNEYGTLDVPVGAFEMDAQVVRWHEFLAFAEAGGYAQPQWWSAEGRAWLAAVAGRSDAPGPRYLRRVEGAWQQWRHGQWSLLDLAQPACHLTWFEADAWCRWAGRRLPTEAEWDYGAARADGQMRWGDVWEWTASAFAPFPGFVPHPYQDYSAPWFDGRPVLRGASYLTQPRMRHAHYRNFFEAHRSDVPAGFRSCAARASS